MGGLLHRATQDARVRPLLDQVRLKYRVKYHRSKTALWGSDVRRGDAHIEYQDTKHPGAALAHELLHVLTQDRGYRRLRIGLWASDDAGRMTTMLNCLDNELQHHKMYPEFQQLGFAPHEFYADSDADTPTHLEQFLASAPTDVRHVVPMFFTVIAPGGVLDPVARADLEARFTSLHGGKFAPALRRVAAAVNGWAVAATHDAESTVREVFLAMEDPCVAWIGYTDTDRPGSGGFFIGDEFEVDDSN